MWFYAISRVAINLHHSHPQRVGPLMKQIFADNRHDMLACVDLESAVKILSCLKATHRLTPHHDPVTPIIFKVRTPDQHRHITHNKKLDEQEILRYLDKTKSSPGFFNQDIQPAIFHRSIKDIVGIDTLHLTQLELKRDVHAAYYLDARERLVKHDLRFGWKNLAVTFAETTTGFAGFCFAFSLHTPLLPENVFSDLLEQLNQHGSPSADVSYVVMPLAFIGMVMSIFKFVHKGGDHDFGPPSTTELPMKPRSHD